MRPTQDEATAPGVTLDTLTWFVRAAEAGSLSRAAARAQAAQSTASRAIARLEAVTGLALFHRTGRSFSLTEAGADLLPRAHEVLAGLEAFQQAAAVATGTISGAVRLSLCSTLGRHRLLPALLAWAKQRPTMHLDLRFEERNVDPRTSGIDVVVRAGRPPDSDVCRTPLGDYGHALVAAPAWVRRHGRPVHPSALVDVPTLALRLERVWSTWVFQKGREQIRVETTPCTSLTDSDALVDAALAGTGATVLPDYLVAKPLAEGRLVALCEDHSLPRIPVFAFHVPRRRLTVLAREALATISNTLLGEAKAVQTTGRGRQ